MSIVLSDYFVEQALVRKRSWFQSHDGFWVGLFKNDYFPVHNSSLTDFLDATFDGYSVQALSWPTAPVANGDGTAVLTSAAALFTPTAIDNPCFVYGWYAYVTFAIGDPKYMFGDRILGGPVFVGSDLVPLAVFIPLREMSIP